MTKQYILIKKKVDNNQKNNKALQSVEKWVLQLTDNCSLIATQLYCKKHVKSITVNLEIYALYSKSNLCAMKWPRLFKPEQSVYKIFTVLVCVAYFNIATS